MKAMALLILLSMVLLSTAALAGEDATGTVRTGAARSSLSIDPQIRGSKAEVPGMISFQGTLTDDDGVALDTTVSMIFTIYTDSTGGSVEWTETQPAVLVSDGIFNVLLGRVSSISNDVFSDPERWLGIRVGGDPELAPRQRIGAVGYAFRATEADTAQYARTAVVASDSDWTISGDDMYSAVDGNVGIGTASPEFKLSLDDDGGIIAKGTYGSGDTLSTTGTGTRLIWYPRNAAFRAGKAYGSDWDASNIGDYSIALGEGPKATGDNSFALGRNATASESNAFALGDYATASGYSAIALGNLATASGRRAIAMGGWGPSASGESAVAVGESTNASGDYSITLGYFTEANGKHSVAIGSGIDNTNRLVNDIPYSLMVGFYTTTPTLFVGGPDHHVGIGTASPAYKLDVADTAQILSFKMPTGAAAGHVLTSDANGVGSWQTPSATDNDWVRGTPDSVLFTANYLGIARGGADNVLYGINVHTHINLGVACTTGADGLPLECCTVSGGKNNTASGQYWKDLDDGDDNTVSGSRARIGGGGATVGGGYQNTASGEWSTVGGGFNNTANGYCASVGGGYQNTARGEKSTVGGGYRNSIEGWCSAIPGGYADTITTTGDYSYLFGIKSKLTQDSTFMVDMPHIRFGDEANGYEFPLSDGSNGQVLVTDGSGTLSWQTGSGCDDGDWTISGNDMYSAVSGNVGIGTSSPDEKLQVDGALKISTTSGHLLLHDTNGGGNWPGIRFTGNSNFLICGDDSSDENFGLYSQFSNNRTHDAQFKVYGKAAGSWGKYIEFTHDGTDGFINTDAGDLVLSPAGNVGIGTVSPTSKLGVLTTDGTAAYLRTTQNSSSAYGCYAEAAPGDNTDAKGVYAVCDPADYYGYGVWANGGYHGVYGQCIHAAAGHTAYGVYGFASGGTTNYGVYYSGGLGGSGSKSAIVRTEEGPKAVYCQESPENWFEDFGTSTIYDGRAQVQLADDFRQTVTIDGKYPMKVFITPNAPIGGEWWVEKSTTGFTLVAPEAPAGAQFDYRVVAKRRGFEDLRLESTPAAYADRFLYPDVSEVPMEYRAEWLKSVSAQQPIR